MASRKLEALFLTAFLALNVLGTLASVAQANFSPLPPAPKNVYIHADGTIEPYDAPFIQVGNDYVMTKNLTYCALVIERGNITLDGAGHILWNEYWTGSGINVTNLANVTVKNLNIEGFAYGIYAENVTDLALAGNIIALCNAGIFIHVSTGSMVDGSLLRDTNSGIQLNNSTGALVTKNIIEASVSPGWGKSGFTLSYSSGNLLTKNAIVNITMSPGFQLWNASGNHIYENNLSGGLLDMYIDPNIRAVYPDLKPSVNTWDNGTAGNYWGPYNDTDADHNGINDRPYGLNEYNADYYPLNSPVEVAIPTLTEQAPPTSPTPNSGHTPIPTASLPPTTATPSPTPSASSTPTAAATPTPTLTPSPEPQPPSSDFLLFGGIVTALAAVVAIIASVVSLHKKGLC